MLTIMVLLSFRCLQVNQKWNELVTVYSSIKWHATAAMDTASSPSKTLSSHPSYFKRASRVCPLCIKYTAKRLNLRRFICTKCKFDYCVQCLKDWHFERCVGIGNAKLISDIDIVGTSKSRKRLKRL